jgi:phenylalanyl-tRNA synthetase alpha subunit
MSDPLREIETGLQAIRASYPAQFQAASTEQQLRDANAKLLGKKGDLTAVLKQMGSLAPELRKQVGASVNTLKSEVEKAFEHRLSSLANAQRDAELMHAPSTSACRAACRRTMAMSTRSSRPATSFSPSSRTWDS